MMKQYLAIKRDYLVERERVALARREYIRARMRSLPPDVLARIRYIGYLEQHFNAGRHSPVWQKQLYPGSKRKADAYTRYSDSEWRRLFREHTEALLARYRHLTPEVARRTLACFVLGMTPASVPPPAPKQQEVSRAYRRLSLLHHPDRGGDPEHFIALKNARDVLAR